MDIQTPKSATFTGAQIEALGEHATETGLIFELIALIANHEGDADERLDKIGVLARTWGPKAFDHFEHLTGLTVLPS